MQNPLFLILIVKRNLDNFRDAGTTFQFNERGNPGMQAPNAAANSSETPKSVFNHYNDIHSETERQEDNRDM
jgi:hypothetical protein